MVMYFLPSVLAYVASVTWTYFTKYYTTFSQNITQADFNPSINRGIPQPFKITDGWINNIHGLMPVASPSLLDQNTEICFYLV